MRCVWGGSEWLTRFDSVTRSHWAPRLGDSRRRRKSDSSTPCTFLLSPSLSPSTPLRRPASFTYHIPRVSVEHSAGQPDAPHRRRARPPGRLPGARHPPPQGRGAAACGPRRERRRGAHAGRARAVRRPGHPRRREHDHVAHRGADGADGPAEGVCEVRIHVLSLRASERRNPPVAGERVCLADSCYFFLFFAGCRGSPRGEPARA